MLTTLLAAIALQSPNLDKPVTLRTVAKPVADVLADVTSQVGFRFEASQVRDWPIVVSVKSFRAGDLLERIAEVTDSEWVKERDRWVLTRSAARVKKAVEIELADRAARLKPVVDSLPTEMKDEDIAKAAAEIKKTAREAGSGLKTFLSGPSPADVLLSSALRRMPIQEIASAPISSFITYSSLRRPGQRQLPSFPSSTWSNYLALRAKFARLIELPADVQVAGGLSTAALPSEYHVKLGLSRPYATANVNAWLALFGTDGKLLDFARASLAPTAIAHASPDAPAAGQVNIAESSASLMRILSTTGSVPSPTLRTRFDDTLPVGPPDPSLAPEIIAKVVKAIEGEPLAYAVSDWLLDLSAQSGKNLVAYIPDHAFTPLHQRLGSRTTHDVIWKAMPELGLEPIGSATSIVIKPRMFARADRYRVDRKALRKLVASSGSYGLPRLNDLLEYVEHSPTVAYMTNLDVVLLQFALRKNYINYLSFQEYVDALRLIRAHRLSDGGSDRLTHADATARFASLYEAMIRSTAASRSGSGIHASSSAEFPKEAEIDPFSALPVAPQTPVILHMGSPFEGVLAVFEGGRVSALTPGGLGTFLGLRPENFSGFNPILSFKALHPAKIVRHSFILRAGNSGSSFDIEDVEYRANEKWTVDQLPSAWKDQLEEGRKEGAGIRMSIGGHTPPP